MVSELKRKEVTMIYDMVSSYNNSIKDSKAALDAIDEKYKKIIEQEKKDLKESIAECKTQLKMWEKMYSAIPPEIIKEVFPDADTAVKEEEQEEIVVDALYPENNDSAEDSAAEPVQDEAAEVEEEVEEEVKEQAEDGWKEIFADDEEDSEKGENDGWPEMPKEWQ